VKYELGFYIPEDDILHSHRRENLKPYIIKIRFLSLTTLPVLWAPEDDKAVRDRSRLLPPYAVCRPVSLNVSMYACGPQ
jgi:hypothetical protein